MKQKNGVPTTQDVLTHHLSCFGDIAGTMADYTAESRFFTPNGLLWRLRGDSEIASVWKAETADIPGFEPIGSDTFIVRNGKILTQTFAGKISPKQLLSSSSDLAQFAKEQQTDNSMKAMRMAPNLTTQFKKDKK